MSHIGGVIDGNVTFTMQTIIRKKILIFFSLHKLARWWRYKSVNNSVTLSLVTLNSILLYTNNSWNHFADWSLTLTDWDLNMSEFRYLPAVVVIVLLEYLFILAVFKYCCCLKSEINKDESNIKGLSQNKENKVQTTVFRFEDTYNSFLPGLEYLLFVTRFLSFCYLSGVSITSK
jgi:hypothetical protein